MVGSWLDLLEIRLSQPTLAWAELGKKASEVLV
jgi:hypothetical protein